MHESDASVPLRVLVVDDNANQRRSLRVVLQLEGFEVETAAEGSEGLQQLLDGAFDAALVDLSMPGVDGFEVARRYRAARPGGGVRLVALSGMARPEDAEEARAAGFERLLVKPVDPHEMVRVLRGEGRPPQSA